MKDAVQRVLRVRMPGQIVENFRCRRWERTDKHAFGSQSFRCSNRRACTFGCGRPEEDCAPLALARISTLRLKMRSPEGNIYFRARTRIGIASENALKDNFVLESWQIFTGTSLANALHEVRTILSTLRRLFDMFERRPAKCRGCNRNRRFYRFCVSLNRR
jgi:hypothetical protein